MKTTSVTALQLSSQITVHWFHAAYCCGSLQCKSKGKSFLWVDANTRMWFCLIYVETLNQGPQHDSNPGSSNKVTITDFSNWEEDFI